MHGSIPDAVIRKLKLEELGRPGVEEYRKHEKFPVILVLDNIRSALNVGAAFRIADAFAAESIYLCGITATPPHREILKTSLGASESVAWRYFKFPSAACEVLEVNGYTIIPVEQTTANTPLQEMVFVPREKYAFVFGHEVSGVTDEIIQRCGRSIEIPQLGTKHSLNVATAIGIVLWEYVRTRVSS